MNCGEFESRLDDWLDGLQPELSFAAAAHARRCSRCGELLAAHELLMAGMRELPLPEPRADFSLRVVEEVTAYQSRPASEKSKGVADGLRWLAGWSLPLAAAAVVALVAVGRSWLMPAGTTAADRASGNRGYVALIKESGLANGKFTKPAWIGQMTGGLKPLPSSMGAVLLAQPLSPIGAALLALNSTAPGA